MPIEISGTTVIDDSRNIVNVNNFGNSDTVYTGNGANLSDIEFGARNFVASGTIPNGSPVVINIDGTVGAVTQTVPSTPTLGSPVEYRSSNTDYISATFDSTNGKVVTANRGGKEAIVGTVSGTSISFGTAVSFTTDSITQTGIAYDPDNNRVVVVYNGNTSGNPAQGRAVVGTVTGDLISFGSPVIYEGGGASDFDIVYDSSNQKVVIVYQDGNNSNYGTAIVGTVSNNTITFGTPVVFESASTSNIAATYDSTNNKVVIAYDEKAIVGTVSGTSISFGTAVAFDTNVGNKDITYDSTNQKVVIAYTDVDNSNYGTAVVGTVSGTSISFGTPVVFESANSSSITATHDPDSNRVIIVYRDGGNSNYGTVIVGTVSGTNISFGSPVVFNSAATNYNASTYDSANKRLVSFYQNTANGPGTAIVFKNVETNLTTENYVGLAAEAISDTATGKITIASGINESQSGLTTARKYYVQTDGTLDTDPDIPSIEAGVSISATQINVGA